jgi:hypothetical protein
MKLISISIQQLSMREFLYANDNNTRNSQQQVRVARHTERRREEKNWCNRKIMCERTGTIVRRWAYILDVTLK